MEHPIRIPYWVTAHYPLLPPWCKEALPARLVHRHSNLEERYWHTNVLPSTHVAVTLAHPVRCYPDPLDPLIFTPSSHGIPSHSKATPV